MAEPVDPRIASKVETPATALAIVGGIGVLFGIIGGLINLVQNIIAVVNVAEYGDVPPYLIGQVTGALCAGILMPICGAVVLYGALKMRKLQSHGLAMVAAILAMTPCVGGFCCVLGLPVGIWALITLMDDEVKEAFGRQALS